MSDSPAVACDGRECEPPVEVRELEPLLLRIPDAAKVLGISERLAYDWARDGIIPTITLGSKRRVPVNLLRDLIARQLPGEAPA